MYVGLLGRGGQSMYVGLLGRGVESMYVGLLGRGGETMYVGLLEAWGRVEEKYEGCLDEGAGKQVCWTGWTSVGKQVRGLVGRG